MTMFGAEDKKQFLAALKKFYSDEEEKEYGVVGIEIKLIEIKTASMWVALGWTVRARTFRNPYPTSVPGDVLNLPKRRSSE